MPNHCYQKVKLSGHKDFIRPIYSALTKNRFCDLVIPQPFYLYHVDRAKDSINSGWYDWRIDNWGTKWDICDMDIEKLSFDPNAFWEKAENPQEIIFRCWTAWTPPIPVWKKLEEVGVKVEAFYLDEGMIFCGKFINGEDICGRCDEEENPTNIMSDVSKRFKKYLEEKNDEA